MQYVEATGRGVVEKPEGVTDKLSRFLNHEKNDRNLLRTVGVSSDSDSMNNIESMK